MKLRAENMIKKYRSRFVVKDVSIEVKQGEIVRAGDIIGTVGSTGNVSNAQLHFQIRKSTYYCPQEISQRLQ